MREKHGGDIYGSRREWLDFSVNTGPLGMPATVLEAASGAVAECIHYPDVESRRLKSALAQYHQLPGSYFICGSGAADILFSAVLAGKPRKALLLSPAFSEYEQALAAVGCRIVYHELKAEQDFLLEDSILRALDEDLDMVFLCNPNNPTGRLIPEECLVKIVEKCGKIGALLVADECFMDFVSEKKRTSLTGYVGGSPKILILKAFTKLYGMAGLRLGYGICSDPGYLDQMESVRQPWSVSVTAEAAGLAALCEKEFVEETLRVVFTERHFLKAGLEGLGCRVIPSDANFLLFRTEEKGLKERLEKQGVLIRPCGNFKGLDDSYYRVAVKRHTENERLLQCLADGRKLYG